MEERREKDVKRQERKYKNSPLVAGDAGFDSGSGGLKSADTNLPSVSVDNSPSGNFV